MTDMLFTLGASNPVDHVVNQPYASGDIFGLHGVWIWSAHVGNLVLSGLITLAMLAFAASRIRTGPESQGTDRDPVVGHDLRAVEQGHP